MQRTTQRVTIALVSVLTACTGASSLERARAADTFAFVHVNVVDVAAGSIRPDRNVIIEANRIVADGPASSTPIPAGAETLDGTGKYLIPGLWDMHVHTTMPGGRDVLPLYVANGVLGVRGMADDWAQLQQWRREIDNGSLIGPRMIASGPYLEGGDVPIPHLDVRKPEDAQPAVDSLIKLGVDFVKVHSQLTRETYFAIAAAAKARGISFVGHVPRTVGAAAASDAGQRSIEHLLTIPNICTTEEARTLAPRFTVQSALGACTTEDLAPLFAKLVSNGTWVVPTLVAQLEVGLWPKRELPGDSLAHYLPDSLRAYVRQIFPMPDSIPPDADVVGRALFDKRVAVTGALHRAGVRLMAGTDAPLRNSPPGFGLHEELLYFVRAGLSPAEALRTATLEPARFLAMTDSMGTIEPGKLAEVVLLDANPLDNIGHTRRVSAVVRNGRVFVVRRTPRGPRLELLRSR